MYGFAFCIMWGKALTFYPYKQAKKRLQYSFDESHN